MTAPTDNNKDSYPGNDATTSFSFTFEIAQASDLEVTRLELDGTTETPLVLDTDYTVIPDDTFPDTGNITYPISGSPLATGERITLVRIVDLTQLINLENQGGYFPEVLEGGLDKLTYGLQQLSEELIRALKLPVSDVSGANTTLPSPVALKTFRWNAAGTALEQTDDPAVSAAAAAVSAAAASAAQTGAETAETNAETAETNAEASEIAAAASAVAAAASAVAAAASAASGGPWDKGTFTPQASQSLSVGEIGYSSDTNAFEMQMDIAAQTLQVGHEVIHRIKNMTGAQIDDGTVVYISGASGNINLITKARADVRVTSEMIGVTTHDVVDNAQGLITLIGDVNGIDTSSFNEGDVVYLDASTAGAFTATKPISPNYAVKVGHIARAHATLGVLTVISGRPLDNTDVVGALTSGNRLINGLPVVNQRGAQAAVSATTYFADRWEYQLTASTAIVNLDIVTAISEEWLEVDISTADAAIAAGDLVVVQQKIEGFNVASLHLGEAAAATVTISFKHAHTKTGIHCLVLKNSAGDRNYIVEYTQAVTNTEETTTKTITLDVTGTWLVTNGVGLTVAFALAAGSTFQGAADAWQAGDLYATANQVNDLDNAANFFRIREVQLEIGMVANTFEQEDYGITINKCYRYFQTFGNGVHGHCGSTTSVNLSSNWVVAMRANPTLTLVDTTPTIFTTANFTGVSSTISFTGYNRKNGQGGLQIDGFTGLGAGDACLYNDGITLATSDAEI